MFRLYADDMMIFLHLYMLTSFLKQNLQPPTAIVSISVFYYNLRLHYLLPFCEDLTPVREPPVRITEVDALLSFLQHSGIIKDLYEEPNTSSGAK